MGAWAEEVAVLLDEARDQIQNLAPIHDQALDDAAVRDRFRVRIKGVLENQRSALDYLAVGITTKYGTPKRAKIYFPLAKEAADFPSTIGSKMPGVLQGAPEIAEVIRRHQPFAHNGEWLTNLNMLTREQKHNRLTVQIVRETYTGRVTEVATGAAVDWDGIRFDQGSIHSEGGGIGLWPEPGRPSSSPKPIEVGAGPTGIMVFGVPINIETQQPYPDSRLMSESGRIERWNFMKPHLPVLWSLMEFDGNVRRVVEDVLAVAR